MKIAVAYFTCARDRMMVEASIISLKSLMLQDVEFKFYAIYDKSERDEWEDVDNAESFETAFPRQGNLNGLECVEGMLWAMRIITGDDWSPDWVLKLDSDVLALNATWLPLLRQPLAFVGGLFDFGYMQGAWGGAYFLAAEAIWDIPLRGPQKRLALEDANETVSRKLFPQFPEDETISALMRSRYPDHFRLVGCGPAGGWIKRVNYLDPQDLSRFDFVEFGGNAWQLGKEEGPALRYSLEREMIAFLEARLSEPATKLPLPLTGFSTSPKVAILSFGSFKPFLPLARHYMTQGRLIKYLDGTGPLSDLDDCDTLAVWNGTTAEHEAWLQEAAAQGLTMIFAEQGWFPQSKTVYFDRCGVNAAASIMDDPLDWVTDEMMDAFEVWRRSYARQKLAHDFVLVPLQLEHDTQIKLYSPFRTMQEFIDHCCAKFQGERLVFKRHPLDRANYDTNGHQFIKDGKFLAYARNASLVYGINSTALLEAAMIPGQEVEAIGEGFLRKPEQRERVLAALMFLQVDKRALGLTPFVRAHLKI